MGVLLSGKVAVVTGSGNEGIGKATALALAGEGARVVVNDIAKTADGQYLADKVVSIIKNSGGSAAPNHDSVASMQGGENIIKTAIDNFGRVDILVNCAGNVVPARSFDMTEAQWDSMINVHLKGHFACVKAAIPYMIKQKNGRIINFSSAGATFGGFSIGYSAAKAGVVGLTTSLSDDLKEFGITVNCVLPSAVTSLFPHEDRSKGLGDNMPVSPWLGPGYIAPLIVYLSSNDAQKVTGQLFHASGGDICIYAKPFQLPGPHQFIRKDGKWTPEEIGKVIGTLIKV
jgi:NAD(P)-dependent dehydrogenase (short-subunit alcohol dehydrogenase family)